MIIPRTNYKDADKFIDAGIIDMREFRIRTRKTEMPIPKKELRTAICLVIGLLFSSVFFTNSYADESWPGVDKLVIHDIDKGNCQRGWRKLIANIKRKEIGYITFLFSRVVTFQLSMPGDRFCRKCSMDSIAIGLYAASSGDFDNLGALDRKFIGDTALLWFFLQENVRAELKNGAISNKLAAKNLIQCAEANRRQSKKCARIAINEGMVPPFSVFIQRLDADTASGKLAVCLRSRRKG